MRKKVQLNNLWLGSLFFLVLFYHSSYAVVCDVLPKLSLEQCGHYDFIAYGKVETDFDCENEKFSFQPIFIFKGFSKEKNIVLYTPCSDGGLHVSKGEYWIIYGFLNNAQELRLSICGHSRKQIPEDQIDYFQDIRGSNFKDDLAFLKENFTLKSFGEKELLPKKYQKVDPKLVPILLGVGLLFMLIGYFVIKKMK